MPVFPWRAPQAKHYGLLAEFDEIGVLARACEQVRDRNYTRWDSHTPYPVHGLPAAMGLKPTPVPWFVLIVGLGGAAAGFLLQTWTHLSGYPLVISGKPLFSWPAYVPITFELGVLGGAAAAVVAALGLSRLPMHHHPLFNSERFEASSDDRYFISIESADPQFDPQETAALLTRLGAINVELLENEPS